MRSFEYMNFNDFLEEENFTCLANSHEEQATLIQTEHVRFSVYELKINLCTYFKGKLNKRIRVVGIPLSVSEKGYEPLDEEGLEQLANWLKEQKGLSIILNADPDFDLWLPRVETLPTMMMPITWGDFEVYKKELRSHYRYRLKKAEERFSKVVCKEDISFQENEIMEELYPLYEAVFEKSEFKLDRCTKEYFRDFQAECTAFYIEGIPLGFCQFKIVNGVLYFLFCGIHYEYLKQYDTYYNMLLYLIKVGISRGAKSINFGQTTEITKGRLGAHMEKRYLYFYHSNGMIRWAMKTIAPLFSYQPPMGQYKTQKGEKLGL